eukprot:484674_1
MPPPGNMNMGGPPMMNQMGMNNNMNMNMNMGPPPNIPQPPLSGPNPFMMGPPMMNRPNQPNITVGLNNQLGPNTMINPSPPPPNQIPPPPLPSNFKINKINDNQQDNNNKTQGDTQGQSNGNNDQNKQIGDNQGQTTQGIINPNKFQLPFQNLPTAFPAPPAPQLNMTRSGPGTGPNTPQRIGPAPPMMPTFLPLGGMNNVIGNPMFGNISGIPQLSPQMKPNSTSNSPQLHGIQGSPPNLFVPPFPAANPPPPHLGMNPMGMNPIGMINGIPSPNIANLPMGMNPNFNPNFNPNQQRNTRSPSPPVSPLMNGAPLMHAPNLPFIPSPQMLQLNNPAMPPINLNKPPITNLTNKFNNMNMNMNMGANNMHNPLIMQNNMPNPMLNKNQPQHPPNNQ